MKRRLIALLAVLVFGAVLFSPPVAALSVNPDKPRIWLDGDPWNEADDDGDNGNNSPGGGEPGGFPDWIRLYTSKYFMVYFLPKTIGNTDSLDKDDPSDVTDTEESREAPTR